MTYTIKSVENEQGALKIFQDDLAESPRVDMDNLGSMICWHSRYNLGDKHSYSDTREFLEDLVYDFKGGIEQDIMDDMEDSALLEIIQEHAVILPLYLYDHSGITMNTTGFSCGWDSGQVGWTYVTHNDIVNEYGKLDLETAESCLKSEVETYDMYLTGDVYYFSLEDNDGNVIESCGGFYGLDSIVDDIDGYIGSEYNELTELLKNA